jgi:leucyl aminopeptidase
MEFQIVGGDLAKTKTACLIIGVFEKRKLSGPAEAVDKAADGALTALLRKGELDGGKGWLLAYELPGIAAERVLLLGLGKRKECDHAKLTKAMAPALARLAEAGVTTALLALPSGLDGYAAVRAAALQAAQGAYRYEQTKAPKKDAPKPLQTLAVWVEKAQRKEAERGIAHGGAIADGVRLARELGNLPGNICTPTYLAERALDLADGASRDHHRGVGGGRDAGTRHGRPPVRQPRQPPAGQAHRHALRGGEDKAKPVVLVGKGLTFDAGGISIKPAAEMDEMKYDMAGGASVFGAMLAAVRMGCPST